MKLVLSAAALAVLAVAAWAVVRYGLPWTPERPRPLPNVDWTGRLALEVGRVESVPPGVRVEPIYWWPRHRR